MCSIFREVFICHMYSLKHLDTRNYFPPEVRSMKYFGLEVFMQEYFMPLTYGNNTARITALNF